MIQDENIQSLLNNFIYSKAKNFTEVLLQSVHFFIFSKIFSITKLQMNKSGLKDNEGNHLECNSFCNKK